LKTELKGTAVLVAAAAVFMAGCLAWAFPRAVAAFTGDWLLPVLSLTALVLTLALAWPWPLLRGLLLALAILLALSWNRASASSTSHFAGAALGLLLMAGLSRSVTTLRHLRLALLLFVSAGAFMVAVGLAGSGLRPGKLLDTAGSEKLPSIKLGLAGLGPGGDVNSNALAAAVLLVLPVGLAVLALATRARVDGWALRAASVTAVLLGSVALVLSHSRTAAIAVWLIAVGLLVRGMRPWLARVIAGAIVVGPVVLLAGRLPFLTHEVAMRDANNSWVSAQGRAQIMGRALEQLKESPWIGIGLNEFRHVYAPRPGDLPQDEDIAHVHNIVLQTALDIGVLGSAAYWGVLIVLWTRASQAARGTSSLARAAAVGAALSIVAATLFGLTDAVPLGSKVGTMQWAAGGLILAAWQLRTASDSVPS
jgi:putative inorganic carbon (HCO3(-)) transporter